MAIPVEQNTYYQMMKKDERNINHTISMYQTESNLFHISIMDNSTIGGCQRTHINLDRVEVKKLLSHIEKYLRDTDPSKSK